MRKNKSISRFERGQSTLEMIAIAPMLFGFIYMVFSYGVPIYYKLGLQNIAYSFAMSYTRMPFPIGVSGNLFEIVQTNVTNGIPGFGSDDYDVAQQGSSNGESFISDRVWFDDAHTSMIVDTKLTMGVNNDPMYDADSPGLFMKLWNAKMGAGAIGPKSPFISCETGSVGQAICKRDPSGSSSNWVWK